MIHKVLKNMFIKMSFKNTENCIYITYLMLYTMIKMKHGNN